MGSPAERSATLSRVTCSASRLMKTNKVVLGSIFGSCDRNGEGEGANKGQRWRQGDADLFRGVRRDWAKARLALPAQVRATAAQQASARDEMPLQRQRIGIGSPLGWVVWLRENARRCSTRGGVYVSVSSYSLSPSSSEVFTNGWLLIAPPAGRNIQFGAPRFRGAILSRCIS
jgi:hypothetical protein